ncbi:MAG: SagB/ThcOx family dehydrogenase [Actinomycetota bacterium]|nr:SagB/ThcOx family dehydrogenase [Actinomycetota bacterium]
MVCLTGTGCGEKEPKSSSGKLSTKKKVQPETMEKSAMSLDEALAKRRSVRSYSDEPLTNKEISGLLWAAQGETNKLHGFRTSPSAGATYPLKIYLLSKGVLSLYNPESNSLEVVREDVDTARLARDCLSQMFIAGAPAVFVLTAVYGRTGGRYGARGERYVHMEAGHAAQNLLLKATALGLGGVPVGAFDDDAVSRTLTLGATEKPLYIIPVGHERK